MSKVIAYRLIAKDNDNTFNAEVQKALADGWELYGFPSVAKNEWQTNFIQAVVKREEETNWALEGKEIDHKAVKEELDMSGSGPVMQRKTLCS